MSNTTQQHTLMLIDGHSLAFRAFYAIRPDSFQHSSGQHTNAVYGFMSMLINLLGKYQPAALAIAFDVSRHSFRTDEYPEYKGTRGETPAEFKGQVPLLQAALQELGITTIAQPNYEADDILATLATRGKAAGQKVLVVSGDRDTIQLVDDDVTLLYPSKQGVSALTHYDPAAVLARYGVPPAQYPEVAALVGETSDNLPGVPRVGEKTAVKWLQQFGSLAELLRRQNEVTGKVGESLRENAHLAERNRRLNHLLRDMPLEVELAELELGEISSEQLHATFGRLEFPSLLNRWLKLHSGAGRASGDDAGGPASAALSATGDPTQCPEPLTLSGAALAQWLDSAANSAICLQESASGVIIGIAANDSVTQLLWPAAGSAEQTQDLQTLQQWLLSDSSKLLFDAKTQLALLRRYGGDIGGISDDALLATWLLQPSKPEKSIASAVLRYLQEVVPEADPNQLVPDESASAGPAQLAWYLSRLHPRLLGSLDAASLRVYREIEMPLLPVLAALERRGVAIDLPLLGATQREFADNVAELEKRAFAALGHEVNLSSPKQLQEVLFTELQMPKTRKTRTGYSTDAAALADLQLQAPHPFVDALLAHRDANKLRQIVETLAKAVAPADGRIHTTLLQSGTSTGRIASAEPNLQNIPARSAAGRRIREVFCHSAEYDLLLTADYSQIEMRIMAHLSEDAGLIAAFQAGEDLHRFVGSRIFGVPPAEVSGEMRTKVKAMSYGLVYGLSAFGLAKQLRITPAEAKQLMGDYFARFGGVRDYLQQVVERARTELYTETIFGRRRPFTDLQSPNRVVRENAERAALNAPIQGAAADIIKVAMINVEKRIKRAKLRSRMLLQIHDELMFEVVAGEQEELAEIVTEEMVHAAQLRVPLEVQLGYGHNWNQAAH